MHLAGVDPGVRVGVLDEQPLEVGLVERVQLGQPGEPAPLQVRLGGVARQGGQLLGSGGALRESPQGRLPTARVVREGEAQVGDPGEEDRPGRPRRPVVRGLDQRGPAAAR